MAKVKEQSLEGKVKSIFYERILPVYQKYPHESMLEEDLDRIIFYANLLSKEDMIRPGVHLVDLGSGLSYFPALIRYLGLDVTMVDDFGGGGGVESGIEKICEAILKKFEDIGVTIIRQDLLSHTLPMRDESVDAVTCFHSLEHWHHSPRRLFSEIRCILKPGGILVLSTPNSVNLRKRLWVLLGKTNLCPLEEWYCHGEPFRGHVREPTVDELKKVLGWKGFSVTAVLGRNFIGRRSFVVVHDAPRIVREVFKWLVFVLDPILRLRPTLCSDIHVVGKKLNKR